MSVSQLLREHPGSRGSTGGSLKTGFAEFLPDVQLMFHPPGSAPGGAGRGVFICISTWTLRSSHSHF